MSGPEGESEAGGVGEDTRGPLTTSTREERENTIDKVERKRLNGPAVL